MLKSIWTENCDLVVMDLNESVATCCQAVSDSCHGATVSLPLVPGLIKHNYIQTTVSQVRGLERYCLILYHLFLLSTCCVI